MTINFEAIFIRKPINNNINRHNDDNWQDYSFQWKVLINNQSFDYFMEGTPKKPTLDEVLHCLISDYEALEQSYYEWCSTFGYDIDSMKAQQIYMACQQNSLKLKKTGIDIAAERERLQDF